MGRFTYPTGSHHSEVTSETKHTPLKYLKTIPRWKWRQLGLLDFENKMKGPQKIGTTALFCFVFVCRLWNERTLQQQSLSFFSLLHFPSCLNHVRRGHSQSDPMCFALSLPSLWQAGSPWTKSNIAQSWTVENWGHGAGAITPDFSVTALFVP